MIERLVLKNFKSYEDSTIEFSPGLNIFLGEVGAGKTSILEAISFALFGRYAGSINQGGLIRRGSQKTEISVIVSTQSGRYKIDRTIYPTKTQQVKMWFFDGGRWKLAVEGATAISRSVEIMLNVDTSTFLAAIYASQGEIKEMLETQPGKRRERLDKLLGIDTYENIWKNLGDARSIVLEELTQAQNKASGVAVLENQLVDLKNKIKKDKKEVSQLKTSQKKLDEKLKPTEQRLKEFDNLKQGLTTVRTQIESKLAEIAKSNQTLNSLREREKKADEAEKVYEENKKFMDLEKNLEQKKWQVEKILQQKSNLDLFIRRDVADLKQAHERQERLTTQMQELKKLREELEQLEKQRKTFPELREKEVSLGEKLEELKEKLFRVFSEIETHTRKMNRVTELGECPTCLQTVPDEHKERIRKETSEIITTLKVRHSTLEKAKDKVQEQLREFKKKTKRAEKTDQKYVETLTRADMLESRKEELKEVEIKIKAIKANIAEKQEKTMEIMETQETLEEINKKLEDVVPKANLAREAEKLTAVKREVETLLRRGEKNNVELTSQLNKLETAAKELYEQYDTEEHKEVDNQVKALRENRAKTMEGIARLKKSIEAGTLQTKNVKEVLKEKKKFQEKVRRLKGESQIIEVLRHSLRDVVQPVMRKNNVLQVSEAFQSYYQELSNDSIDYAALDEEGNIDITRNGEPSPVNSLSGGETTCAALALRLAICSSLTRNQLLLLDEPTIHLDDLYRAKLRDFLGSHSFEQLIVVTHDNTFDSLPAKIFRVEKRRSGSVSLPLQTGGA